MADSKLVRELLRTMKVENQFTASIRALESAEEAAKKRGEVGESMRLRAQIDEQLEKFDAAVERISAAWSKVFSDDEMRELIRIYSSPLMQKLVSPEVRQMLTDAAVGAPIKPLN